MYRFFIAPLFFITLLNALSATKEPAALQQRKPEVAVGRDGRDPFHWQPTKKQKTINAVKKVEPPMCPWRSGGVCLSTTRPCALLVEDNETRVVFVQEELGLGWSVEKITGTAIHLKHISGEHYELGVF